MSPIAVSVRKLPPIAAKTTGPVSNSDPDLQVEAALPIYLSVPRHGAADRKSGQQRAADMVFLGQRRAEQRHKAVAGELRRRASEAVHFGKRGIDERTNQLVHRLGTETLGQCGRIDDVAEQHRDLFNFAGEPVVAGRDPRRGRVRHGAAIERRSAMATVFMISKVARTA